MGGDQDLRAHTREELARLDSRLFAIWNLGDNVLLAWTRSAESLLFLAVRHYAIPELLHAGSDNDAATPGETQFVNDVLAGPKYLASEDFDRVCRAFNRAPEAVRVLIPADDERLAELVSDMVRVYGVSLVRDRAVMLLDAMEFSPQTPLEQMAMLNSLAFSVNSAYGQLLAKDIQIDFARSTTGRIQNIRCYLTGRNAGSGAFLVNRYHLRDKHSTMRTVYNAKINIHCDAAEPIFLGIRGGGAQPRRLAHRRIPRQAAIPAPCFASRNVG